MLDSEQTEQPTDAEEIMAAINASKEKEEIVSTEHKMPEIEKNNLINAFDLDLPTKVEVSEDMVKVVIAGSTPTKFCDNCGIMLTDNSSICPSCGEPID